MVTAVPQLSIVITSCNQLNQLRFTLLALRDQQPDIPCETIVVDCGSTDGSGRFLTDQANSGTIRTILETQDLGRTEARNRAAHLSNGKYIMFLEPGVLVGPRWWKALISTLDMDPAVGAVAGRILLPDGRIDHAGLALIQHQDTNKYGLTTSSLSGRSIHAGRPADTPGAQKSLYVRALAGEAILIRSTAFFNCGGFSTDLGITHAPSRRDAAGDPTGMDFCIRLAQKGWSAVYRPESIVTRLRPPCVSPDRGDKGSTIDEARFSDKWEPNTRSDFVRSPESGICPTDDNFIRPYIQPAQFFAGEASLGAISNCRRSKVSVIFQTHGQIKRTTSALEAVLKYTDTEHELIILYRNADDKLADYFEKLATENRDIKWLETTASPMSTKAKNQGLALASGKYIVLLDSNVVVTKNWLATLVASAEANPTCGMIGPVTNNTVGLQKISTVGYDVQSLDNLAAYAAVQTSAPQQTIDQSIRISDFCLLIKRELLARIGGFDTSLTNNLLAADDYCLRSRIAGYTNVIDHNCFVHNWEKVKPAAAEKDYLNEVMAQWSVFKAKWKIPAGQTIDAPISLASLISCSYDIERHFFPLPIVDTATNHHRSLTMAKSKE